MGEEPTAADIEGFLAWTLVRLGHGVEQVITASIAEHGLTSRQFGVLALLATHDDLAQSDLARAVLVRAQSIGPLVASLVDRGLVVRHGPGGRGRRTTLALTEAGRRLVTSSWAAVTADNGPARFGLDADDAAALARILPRALDALGRPGTVDPRGAT